VTDGAPGDVPEEGVRRGFRAARSPRASAAGRKVLTAPRAINRASSTAERFDAEVRRLLAELDHAQNNVVAFDALFEGQDLLVQNEFFATLALYREGVAQTVAELDRALAETRALALEVATKAAPLWRASVRDLDMRAEFGMTENAWFALDRARRQADKLLRKKIELTNRFKDDYAESIDLDPMMANWVELRGVKLEPPPGMPISYDEVKASKSGETQLAPALKGKVKKVAPKPASAGESPSAWEARQSRRRRGSARPVETTAPAPDGGNVLPGASPQPPPAGTDPLPLPIQRPRRSRR
jgi:hypothetical protein